MDNIYFLCRRMDVRFVNIAGNLESQEYCEAETMTLFNPDYAVDVDFAGKFFPSISVDVRNSEEPFVTPDSTALTKVLPVSQSDFDKEFNRVIKLLNKSYYAKSEFYQVYHNDDFIELYSFCCDKIHRGSVCIDFRKMSCQNSISVNKTNTYYGRANARKKGIKIEGILFRKLLRLSLDYISHPELAVVDNKRFMHDFEAILSGRENKVEWRESCQGVNFSNEKEDLHSLSVAEHVEPYETCLKPTVSVKIEKHDNESSGIISKETKSISKSVNSESLSDIINKLEERIESIQERLCNNDDDDSREDRISLRGELRGLRIALNLCSL